jgi:hypothetical protein
MHTTLTPGPVRLPLVLETKRNLQYAIVSNLDNLAQRAAPLTERSGKGALPEDDSSSSM